MLKGTNLDQAVTQENKNNNKQLRKGDADKILEIDKEKFKINKAMELSDPPLTCCSNQLKNNPRRQAVLNTNLMQELKKNQMEQNIWTTCLGSPLNF